MDSRKTKNSRNKSSFKSFGAFLFLRKKFAKKNRAKKLTDDDAVEAGFIDRNGHENNHKTTGYNGAEHFSSRNSDTTSLSERASCSTAISGSLAPPGVCGLVNHGATCYINAIVQCLSNTDLLAEYFVMGQYKSDLKNARKERSKKYGTNGELAEQLAVILRSLWTNQYKNSMTKGLRDVMCKYGPQFKGNEQHDSQEFLLWLFDKVHEDLNIQQVKKISFLSRASMRKKRPKKIVENGGLVAETKENSSHIEVPTSFIQKVFQAHYRSTLTCPSCRKQSHTLDPFLCLSLPITQRTTRPVYVNVSYLGNKRRSEGHRRNTATPTVLIGVAAPIDGRVLQLRQAVAAECGIHSRLLTFSELDQEGFGASYGDNTLISDLPVAVPSESNLFAFEMPAPMKMSAGTLPRNFASRHKKRPSIGNGSQSKDLPSTSKVQQKIVIILINKKFSKGEGKIFGRPFIFHVSKEVQSYELQSLIMLKISQFTKQQITEEKLSTALRVRVIDGLPNKSYIPPDSRQPLLLPTVAKALENCPAGGPLHVKLVAEWHLQPGDDLLENIKEEQIEESDNVRLQRVLHQQPVTCSLQECFELLTKDEELGLEDAWHCPHCHKQRHGTLKKLSLLTLPDILIVHLKRFRVVNGKRTKLNTRVDFPIMGLDMAPYLVQTPKTAHNGKGHRVNGLKHFGGFGNNAENTLYDLYAVCNHYGNLNSGHYTAGCCNPLDGRWYLYDDKKTELISEENLSQQSAYMLFYQRRSANPTNGFGGGSVSSLATEHWARSLPFSGQKASSHSHLNHYAINATEPKPFIENGVVEAITTTNHRNSNNNNIVSKIGQGNTEGLTRRYSGSYVLHKKEKQFFVERKSKKSTHDVSEGDREFVESREGFVRGVPKQQSVPRSSVNSRRVSDQRRLSERSRSQRPASFFEPSVDTYQRTTYF